MNEEAIRLIHEAEAQNPSGLAETKIEVPVSEPVQKAEEVSEPEENPTEKKQKIGELIDLKRKTRALSRELNNEIVDAPIEFSAETKRPELDIEQLKEQLLNEAEARLEAKFRPQLDEVESLRQENEKYQSEKQEVKLKSLISEEVNAFIKKYPQSELMIDSDYLIDLIKSNAKNADMTGEELILKVYPNATRTPKMDTYGAKGHSQPKDLDFSNLDEDTLNRINKGGKAQDDFLKHLISNR